MCEICKRYPCHPRCPNYNPTRTKYYCSICGDGIYVGDEYIKNDYGKYTHLSCVDYGNELIKFLGYEVKTMEENDELADII